MKIKTLLPFLPAVVLFLIFGIYTVLVATVDVQAVGPKGSEVGFASLNVAVRNLVGVNGLFYKITDRLGLVPLGLLVVFASIGFVQLVTRGSIRYVDADLLVLGGYYLLVFLFYAFFEVVEINARPVLIGGVLETSYPSSTTMLAMATLPAVGMHLMPKIPWGAPRIVLMADMWFLTAIMVGLRVLSGVHWITDIIGGALLSVALLALFAAARKVVRDLRKKNGEDW